MGLPTVTANDGNLVVIYTYKSGGKKPIHGAYLIKTGDINDWVPASWTESGFFIDPAMPSGMDITKALNEKQLQEAEEALKKEKESLQVGVGE